MNDNTIVYNNTLYHQTKKELEAVKAQRDELLKALTLALDLEENGLVDFDEYELTCDEDIAKVYRRAIAKATGES